MKLDIYPLNGRKKEPDECLILSNILSHLDNRIFAVPSRCFESWKIILIDKSVLTSFHILSFKIHNGLKWKTLAEYQTSPEYPEWLLSNFSLEAISHTEKLPAIVFDDKYVNNYRAHA